MWNPFKKNSQQNNSNSNSAPKNGAKKTNGKQKADDSPKMNMLQRLAMKKIERMNPQEKAKMMQEVLRLENKDKLLGAFELMRKSGQISEEQYRMAKEKMNF